MQVLFAIGWDIGVLTQPFVGLQLSVVQTELSLQREELSILMHLREAKSPVTYEELQEEMVHLSEVQVGTNAIPQLGTGAVAPAAAVELQM
jgi:hypothetical protein